MAHFNQEGRTIGGEKGGRPAKEELWGVGKGPKGTPRVKESNPLPIFGTWGLVRVEEGVTTIGGAPIREDVRV
jgi:hypothetical protein